MTEMFLMSVLEADILAEGPTGSALGRQRSLPALHPVLSLCGLSSMFTDTGSLLSLPLVPVW